MLSYIFRKILHAIPILIGVNLITFILFFMVNTPDDMARMQLGEKYVTKTEIQQWKADKGYDKPLFYNTTQHGLQRLSDTLFYQKSMRLFLFQFGQSDEGRSINHDIYQRMWPSLALAIPTLCLALAVNIALALLLTLFQGTLFDRTAMMTCVALMSISGLFYIIAGQFFFSKLLKLMPISGYNPGWDAYKFLLLPIFIAAISGIGSGVRWYRAIVLEEIHKAYVTTARAKGLSEMLVLFRHVLKNAMLPVLTGVVVIIPTLFMGSLIMESFFSIPGLGSYTIDAIARQDFGIVHVMVFLGTVFYVIGLILTDISYTWVDPRVQLR